MKIRGKLVLFVAVVLASCQICHTADDGVPTVAMNVREATRVEWLFPSPLTTGGHGTSQLPDTDIQSFNSNLTLSITRREDIDRGGNRRRHFHLTLVMNVFKSVYPHRVRQAANGGGEENAYNGFSGQYRVNGQVITAVLHRKKRLPLDVPGDITTLTPQPKNRETPSNNDLSYNWGIPPKYEINQLTWRTKGQIYSGIDENPFFRLTFYLEKGAEITGMSQPIADGHVCEVHVKLTDKDIYDWLKSNKTQFSLFFEAHCFGQKPNRFVVHQNCFSRKDGLCDLYNHVGKTTEDDTAKKASVDKPKASKKRKRTADGNSVNDDDMPSREEKQSSTRSIDIDRVKDLLDSDGYVVLKCNISQCDVSVEAVGVIANDRISRYQIIAKDSAVKKILSREGTEKKCYFNHFVSLPPWQDPPKE
eukprot:GHVS01034439.1.p1 GENE.GHVS01034439.1~~GHVS01034439.1.p1  ORF type:complete len:419 (-),score=26.21 GHVS01034439.1:295-1551(-)